MGIFRTTPPVGLLNALMATPTYQVTHVRLAPSGFGLLGPSFEHIVLLKGPGFVKTRDQVVDEIHRGIARYFTNQTPLAPRAFLEVQLSPGLFPTRYVRTRPDCTPVNNLLSLPRF